MCDVFLLMGSCSDERGVSTIMAYRIGDMIFA